MFGGLLKLVLLQDPDGFKSAPEGFQMALNRVRQTPGNESGAAQAARCLVYAV
jgi:hypothetical protein